jgi:hypothetical protein
VSERKNNEINKMNNEIRIERMYGLENHAPKTKATVLVSCCGCGNEEHISQKEADQWTDTDWFQCHECE